MIHLCRDGVGRVGRRTMVARGGAVSEALQARACASNTDGTMVAVSPAIVESCQDDIASITKRPDSTGGWVDIPVTGGESGMIEVAAAVPSHFGITASRSKAHQDLLPYVPPLAVTIANHPSEFRRCTCVAIKLHGHPVGESSLRSVADLNASFGDAVVHLEQGDGMIIAAGFAWTDMCTIMAVYGLGDSEEDAAYCELHAVMGALKLVAALKQKMNGSELPAHNGPRQPVTAGKGGGSLALFDNRVGCSVGVSSGWVLVGRCGHDARHNVCVVGAVRDTAQRLMADGAANGSILITDAVQKKIIDDVETTTVPSAQLTNGDYFKDFVIHRACQLRSYL